MTLAEKYQLFSANIRQMRQMKRAWIKHKHPEFTPEEIEKELARIWLHARP